MEQLEKRLQEVLAMNMPQRSPILVQKASADAASDIASEPARAVSASTISEDGFPSDGPLMQRAASSTESAEEVNNASFRHEQHIWTPPPPNSLNSVLDASLRGQTLDKTQIL